jgi:hypothetical protein
MSKNGFLLCTLLAAAPGWGRPATPTAGLIVPAAHPLITVEVNGHPLRLKVDLGAHGGIILNPQAAARAGLAKDRPVTMRIGPVKLRGSRASPTFALGGVRWKDEVMWFDRSYVADADGVVGPHHLPFAEVAFEGPGPGNRNFSVEARHSDERGVFVPMRVAGKKVAVRFSLLRPRSFATGSAGALLARQQGGRLDRAVIQQHLGWDISRPTRRLSMEVPWRVGVFSIGDILVRLRDYRGKSVLPTAEAEAGPEDILVRGQVRRQGAEHFLTVGLDQLHNCQSVTYSRLAKQLSFRC